MDSPASAYCFSISDLERHAASGSLDTDTQAHLDRCPSCQARLGSIIENNRLFERMTEAAVPEASPTSIDDMAQLVPGYRIVEEIHRGGQGVVFRAVQDATKRTVALKMPLGGSFSTSRQRRRFEREIETIAGLRHPGIVTIYEGGLTPDDRPYYTMELVDGVTLDRALPEPGTPDIRRRLNLFLHICDTIAFAHRHAVIHRDLKPTNIIIDANDQPHVLDFGVAKAIDAPITGEQTQAGEFMGTLAYAAPEQVSGDPGAVDTRCDVYALGVILFELLAGRKPFESRSSLAAMIGDITEAPPPLPSSLTPGLSRELDAIVLKALHKRPEGRYQSADELAADIRRHLTGRPIEAKRDNTWYVMRKFARRHALPLSLGTSAVVALAIIAIWMAFLSERARLRAQESDTMRIFLEDTLGSVPHTPNRSETTLRSVLDEGVQWVDIALADQPEIAASVRLTIGNSYRNLGLHDKAETQITRALETRREILGPRHPDTATTLNALGLIWLARADPDRAAPLLREALEIRADHFGSRHLTTAMSHMNLSRLERARGDLPAAEHELRMCLDARVAKLGAEHPDVAMCLFELADLRADQGQPDDAERLHREALAVRLEALPEGHPDLARSHRALGELLAQKPDSSEAEQHLRAAAELLESTFGPDHPDTHAAAQVLERFRSSGGTATTPPAPRDQSNLR